LLESELFGHNKGAFTGAHQDKPGIFKVANGGTVFLDEIGNISLEVQAKLLRFLEAREFLPLGSTTSQSVDVRLILATNQDLKERVSTGSFREDFYYRIFVYPINMPPLRERREDILPIAYHFLEQFNSSLGKNISGFESGAVNKLTQYDWPGNVRQLRNAIERAVILCDKERISLRELPFIDDFEKLIESVPSTNEELKRIKKEIRQKAVGEVEKNFVLNALTLNKWNVTQAARKVGLQRTNFQNMMKKHGIKIQRRHKKK
jgi:transcriptional regulator with GAF, ATPase, and Fis domain